MDAYEIKKIGSVIKGNSYVGRGIVIGKTADNSKAASAYFIMGRSENSRNRIFVEEDRDVMIKPFDEAKVEDPSLIIYYPMRHLTDKLIVTNGDQTDTIFRFIDNGDTFEEALRSRRFEPDGPNWTPRISGILDFDDAFLDRSTRGDFSYIMSILKSADSKGTDCNRFFFEYESKRGVGHFIHTYMEDGNPLPTFTGEPIRVEIPDDIDELTNDIWNNLDEDNKISLYVRYIDLETGEETNRFINKNK